MSLDVVEQGGEDGQQRHGHVVDALTDTLHLCARLHELPQFQHLHQLFQVLRCVLEESPKASFDQLRSRLHDSSEENGETRRAEMFSAQMLQADLHLPGVQRVCEDVQAAHHDSGITSCKSNI